MFNRRDIQQRYKMLNLQIFDPFVSHIGSRKHSEDDAEQTERGREGSDEEFL